MVLVVLTRPDERKPASPLHEYNEWALVASLLFRSLSLRTHRERRPGSHNNTKRRPVWSSGRDRSAEARRLARMSIALACQQAMNAFCDDNCPHFALHGSLTALFDSAAEGSAPKAWRCYARSALSNGVYQSGRDYCTRHAQLSEILRDCEANLPQSTIKESTIKAQVDAFGSSTPTIPEEFPPVLPRWTTTEEITLPAVDTSSFVPSEENELLKVHAWEVDCIDDIKKHQLRNRTGNVSARNAFLSRAGLMCYGRCVRGVVDGFATHAEIEEMLSIAPVPKPGQSSDIKQWRWEPPDPPEAPPIYAALIARAKTVLEERYGVKHLRFYRSNMITWHGAHRDARDRWPTFWKPKAWQPQSLHGDTNTDEMFLFTTILYLSQHGEEVLGGETGIADAVEDRPYQGAFTTAGLRVQPSIGRLLVFSAGVENMHEMLPVTHGRRVAVQMWFACEGMNPGWARPQREAWHAEHGWGGPASGAAPTPAPPYVQHPAKPWAWR